MLLAAFLRHFESLPPERFRSLGASSAGSCARRLAMGHFPERFTPEPMTARRRARLMAGSAFEKICQGVIQKELPAHAAGETAFLWPIPVDTDTMASAMEKVAWGRLSGHVLPHMNPNDIPRWRTACEEKGMTRLGGIVLDPERNVVFLPALADGIADTEDHYPGLRYGLGTQEFKTMATAGFRRVLRGQVDYGYRTQFAVQVDAAKLDTHIANFYRLETSHGIEIIYSRRATKVRATFTLTSGVQIVTEGTVKPPVDEWDEVVIEHPFDERLLDDARARIARVLRSTADALPEREVGPSFVCDDCGGSGIAKCAYCDENGVSKRAKDGKACKAKGCEGGSRQCTACERGALQETELPFPCNGWCPFTESCWVDQAGVPLYRIEMPTKPGDAGGRPKFLITHEAFTRSGITFTKPEAA